MGSDRASEAFSTSHVASRFQVHGKHFAYAKPLPFAYAKAFSPGRKELVRVNVDFMLIRTVDSALQMFEAFAEHGKSMTLSEMSRRLAIPTSTCFGLIRTLEARGYLYEVGGRKAYYPTARWLVKSREIEKSDPIYEVIHPHLEKLRDASDETVVLSKRLGDALVYLDVVESRQTIRYIAEVGDLKSLNRTSSGKALLSSLPEREREAVIAKLQGGSGARLTAAQRTTLQGDIARGTKDGWFVGRGETSMDVMGAAVPVTMGSDVFAIGIAGPLARMDPRLKSHARLLLAAGKVLAKQL
ncbi:IclR family transcriptional regulator [Piscinibacter koreensis]|uniref:IclR family transcriptional regulator n=1 Tax=Piscinibacter koreensis TaxID=2742824 RepID=A0A7Y6NR00_9BURK|nr:IclR family transcriptional regulator [Schlegelella koreensis]NUZ07694.1 IclR family transcriptional regulator [Schlegelella koreensis]